MRNPYDRRQQDRGNDREAMGAVNIGMPSGIATPRPPARRGVAMEDLDALALSAHFRGERNAVERLEADHREQLLAARREAWDEGHHAGQSDLLVAIQDEFGERVRGMLLAGNERIRIAEELTSGEMDDAAVRALMQMLRGMNGLLAELIDAHHAAFKARPY